MQLITHQHHLNALPESPIKRHVQKRFDQLTEDTDLPPTIMVLFPDSVLQGSEVSFLGESGIYSDLFGKSQPGDPDFQSVFDWISYDPGVPVFEMLYLEGDLGYTLIFGPEVVDTHPRLKAVIDSQPLSSPQPLP